MFEVLHKRKKLHCEIYVSLIIVKIFLNRIKSYKSKRIDIQAHVLMHAHDFTSSLKL